MNRYLRGAIMAPFIGVGGCLGALVEAIWGVGVR